MTKLDASVPTTRPNATGETTTLEPDCATPTPPAYAAELAALRARLREVEVALGLPLRPGQAVPPDLPALRRRVAALERRAGVVPGLAPLPGCDDAAPPARATTITSEPAGHGHTWRERGRAVLAMAALVAALAWLLHPLPGGLHESRVAEVTATAPAAGAPAASLSPPPDGATVNSPPAFGPGSLDYRAALAYGPDYRVSPPNEEDPVGPGEFDPPDNSPADSGAPPPRDGSRNRGLR